MASAMDSGSFGIVGRTPVADAREATNAFRSEPSGRSTQIDFAMVSAKVHPSAVFHPAGTVHDGDRGRAHEPSSQDAEVLIPLQEGRPFECRDPSLKSSAWIRGREGRQGGQSKGLPGLAQRGRPTVHLDGRAIDVPQDLAGPSYTGLGEGVYPDLASLSTKPGVPRIHDAVVLERFEGPGDVAPEELSPV